MRLLRMTLVALMMTGFWSVPALGCAFDLDCAIGSKCYKPSGSLYGWCVGGMSPGNSNDKKPAYDPMDLTGKKGNTCSFDLDCGIGGQCVKDSGIYGTCL
jgi:hypothetical protein